MGLPGVGGAKNSTDMGGGRIGVHGRVLACCERGGNRKQTLANEVALYSIGASQKGVDKGMVLNTLLLMRHAKSSWKFDDMSDHQRPLNDRGRRAAKAVGNVLRAKDIMPQNIWSSDSMRTRETAKVLLSDAPGTPIDFLEGFYHSSANNALALCAERGEPEIGPLMLLGHNPGWEDLFFYFANRARRMPTGACAVFVRSDEDGDWLDGSSWRLQDLILPRDLEI